MKVDINRVFDGVNLKLFLYLKAHHGFDDVLD